MKKAIKRSKILAVALSALLVGSLFTGCTSSSSEPSASGGAGGSGENTRRPAEFYELSLAHFWPANHIMEVDIIQGWIKAVYDETEGRVKINSFPAGTLIPAVEIYEGIVQGVADIGLSVYAYTRGRFPVLETLLLPGVSFYNSEAASWAAMDAINILDPAELHDVHHIWTWGSGPADLLTRKPVRVLEDLRGMQVGATAGPRSDGLAVLGAAPVIIPLNDWYEALSRGVMAAGVIPLEALLGFRLAEVTADYITLTPFLYNQLFFNVMNKDKWNSLPPDIQAGISRATEKFYAENMPTLWNEINAEGLNFGRKQKEIEIIVLTPEEMARWESYLPPIQEEYVGLLNERGLPGADILKTMKELAAKYNALYPDFAPYIN
jgi:TRAP-type C4-dicarboxylate transport system substrate-binding protein